jgi:putative peptidoglycan lipid II flippase
MGLNVILSLTLPAMFLARGWLPHGGLALANSAATFLEMLALLFLMRRRLRGLEEKQLLNGLGQAALASVAMGLALWFWIQQLSAAPLWLLAAGGVVLGLGIYLLFAWLLRVPELATLRQQLQSRIPFLTR